MTDGAKAALRERMRARRDALPPSVRARESERACARLLDEMPALSRARVVTVFSPFGSEIGLDTLIERLAQASGLRLAAPVALGASHMEFVAIEARELLDRAAMPDFLRHPARMAGMPRGREVVSAAALDFMVIPGVAFDEARARLGYGGGYYDAYLARSDFRAFTCGICFDEQLLAPGRRLPREPHDQLLDAVVTPTRVL